MHMVEYIPRFLERSDPVLRSLSRGAAVAGLVMAGALALTALHAARIDAANRAHARSVFESMAARVTRLIEMRVVSYERGVRGARGPSLALGRMPHREAFTAYARSRDLHAEFPGMRATGQIDRVPRSEADAYVAAARADGAPDFAIHELAPHSGEHYVVRLVEPLAGNRKVVGLDAASDPVRRRAARRAMELGTTQLSGPITLVQADNLPYRGNVMLAAIYPGGIVPATPEARREAAIGWAVSLIVVDEMIRDIAAQFPELRVSIFDLGTRTLLSGSEDLSTPVRGRLHALETINIFGQTWRIAAQPTPAFDALLQPINLRHFILLDLAFALLASSIVFLLVQRLEVQRAAGRRLREEVEIRTAELADKNGILGTILAQTGFAVFASDATGRFTLVNGAAERLFGAQAPALIGRAGLPEFLGMPEGTGRPDAAAPAAAPDFASDDPFLLVRLTEGSAPVREWVMTSRDGTRRPVLLDMRLIRDAQGAPHLMVGVALDLTDRKRIEATLVEARAAAETANATKSAFLATMSHEIRTPLNGVMGMTSLLLATSLDTEQSRFARIIMSSAEALLAIVDDILDISKLEAGRIRLESIPFSPAAVTEDIAALLAPRAAEKNIAIAVHVEAEVGWRLGDPGRLRQVLLNLIGNAVKFTSAGGVEITCRCGPRDELEFVVRDTGIGMSPDQLGRLFEKFAQGDSSISRRFGGTGLGLAISHELLTLMQGRVAVVSAPGTGTTFTAAVPLPRTLPSEQSREGAVEAHSLVAVTRRRILVVEDNPTNALVARNLLEGGGYGVRVEVNGAEAVRACAAEAFAAVLMDAEMPVMDGIEAARRIRRAETEAGLRRTPIIALSANAMSGMDALYAEAGMDDSLAKPYRAAHLLATVARWAGGAPLPRALDPADPGGPDIDEDIARELIDRLDKKSLESLAAAFEADLERWRREIAAARETGDLARLQDIGHEIAGAAGVLGLVGLAQLGRALTRAVRDGEAERIAALAAAIDSRAAGARLELASYSLRPRRVA